MTTATEPRRCYFIDETMFVNGHYQPAIVVENESGYYATNYDYGKDFALAKKCVAELNEERGLTAKDVSEIVTSSMFRGARKMAGG